MPRYRHARTREARTFPDGWPTPAGWVLEEVVPLQAPMGALGGLAQWGLGAQTLTQPPANLQLQAAAWFQDARGAGAAARVEHNEPVIRTNIVEEKGGRFANTFLVGCDPEFVVLNNGAYENLPGFLPQQGPIGFDHGGIVGEFRPEPAKGTYTVLKRLQELIASPTMDRVRNRKWRAGAVVKAVVPAQLRAAHVGRDGNRTITLGGHVHFDFPGAGRGADTHLFNERLNAWGRLTRLLERLDILPRVESEQRRAEAVRAGQHYGALDDWRPAGDHDRRVEYRAMPSWLYHPKVAFLALTGAKLAAVAPQMALDTLKFRQPSFNDLCAFFELFRHRDHNARRVLEKLLDAKDIRRVHADPDADFKENWGELGC